MIILTHPGYAHKDDFLAVCIALYARPATKLVYRKEPTEEELEDASILILDIGNRYEPNKLNFDHHQLPKDIEPECTLSLLNKYLKLHKAFQYQKWYQATILVSTYGPKVAANKLGLKEFPYKLMSPIEDILINHFQSYTKLDKSKHMFQFMRDIGEQLVKTSIELEFHQGGYNGNPISN